MDHFQLNMGKGRIQGSFSFSRRDNSERDRKRTLTTFKHLPIQNTYNLAQSIFGLKIEYSAKKYKGLKKSFSTEPLRQVQSKLEQSVLGQGLQFCSTEC